MKLSNFSISMFILIASAMLFVPFLGSVHLFDWDEINFAECAREMIASKDYSTVKINYQPFWEKPPLFIWMQVISMKLFGINEFAARFPNALCGMVSMIILFNIGRKLYNRDFGFVWVLVYVGSFLPHFYFKSGIIDPWFNLFIFSGIYFFILFVKKETPYPFDFYLLASAFLIGLAILTKGPVALLIFLLCVACYWAIKKFLPIISFTQIATYAVVLFLTGGSWFIYMLLTGRIDILIDFFNYQIRLFSTPDSGHGGPFFYHFIVLLIGCFPSSIIALRAFKTQSSDTAFQKEFKLWMIILLGVVLIVFSIVKTKILHYSSLCYFPLTFLATYSITKIVNYEMGWRKWITALLLFIGLLWGLIVTLIPWTRSFQNILTHFIKDDFMLGNLQANVTWKTLDYLVGPVFLLGLLIILFTLKKRNPYKGIIALFALSALFINICCISITGKVEQYTQGAPVQFYQYLSNKNCYIETIGFKSYAHLFYSQKQPQQNSSSYNINWLLNKKVDKPTYFVSKITEENANKDRYPNIEKLYSKNGFIFYKRK